MVKSFHESVIKDILDAIEDINDSHSGLATLGRRGNSKSLNVSSISRASKDLIMSFPVLCDDSISPRTAAMISKAVERKAVAMLQILFSSYSFSGLSGKDVLSQWHSNIDNGRMSLDDYLDLCDDIVGHESYKESVNDRRALNEAVSNIKIEMKNGDRVYQSSISECSINDYKVITRNGNTIVTEGQNKQLQRDRMTRSRDSGAWDAEDQNSILQRDKLMRSRDAGAWDADNQYARSRAQDMANRVSNYADDREFDRTVKQSQMTRNARLNSDSDTDFIRKQLLDTDIKKSNELTPSLMIVKFIDSENGVQTQFVAGVKSRLIPIDTYEIINRVASKNKDRKWMVNLIRATTKEISFVKDYLLAIDKAKLDAKHNSIRNSKSSGIWKTLEKRSTKSVWKRLWGSSNDAACITTLVISQEAANVLAKEYNTNIADVRTASAIMDAYNLLAICIVDESTEVARFLYDGDSYFEELSFDSLERESGDGSYKKVINLLSKMNR